MARERLTGILLVGGASSRFGSPKALARIGGETLAERAWRILGEACDERLAVGKRSAGLELPFPLVDDATEVQAPLAGVVAGLRAARNDVCVVLPVDAPLVTAPLLRELARNCADAAVPAADRPLPGAYARAALPTLERRLADGALALRDALTELDVNVVAADAFALANVNEPSDLQVAERRVRALDTACRVARAHGIDTRDGRILQDWNDTVVLLAPHPLVARVATSAVAWDKQATYARELAVARHAASRGGPVVAPTSLLDAGPHVADGLVLTFWNYAEPQPGAVDAREAGSALRALHESLRDYPGELPPLDERLDRAAAAAADLGALDPDDRRFLARVFRELRTEVRGRAGDDRVLHGGAHGANLLRTEDGLRWIDLDTVCRGPLEWDLAHLEDAAASAFPEADRELLPTMRALVSAEVAIWCWHTYGRAPEVNEAAHFHLARLRELRTA